MCLCVQNTSKSSHGPFFCFIHRFGSTDLVLVWYCLIPFQCSNPIMCMLKLRIMPHRDSFYCCRYWLLIHHQEITNHIANAEHIRGISNIVIYSLYSVLRVDHFLEWKLTMSSGFLAWISHHYINQFFLDGIIQNNWYRVGGNL